MPEVCLFPSGSVKQYARLFPQKQRKKANLPFCVSSVIFFFCIFSQGWCFARKSTKGIALLLRFDGLFGAF
jgi:hypothetical protein